MGSNKKSKNRKKAVRLKQSQKTKARDIGFMLFFGLLIIGLPFVYYRAGLDPAIHPRLLFVNLVLILSLVYFLFFRARSKIEYASIRNPIFYFIAGYFLITAISMTFAINPREGNYDLNKTFGVLILTIVMTLMLSNTEQWEKKLPLFFIIPAIYLIGVGVSEYNAFVLLAKTERDSSNLPWIYSVRGNMAHKNQFSIALMMMLPFLGLGVYKSKGLLRTGFIAIVIFIMLALFVLQTRSVWVGMAVGVVVVFGFLVISGRKVNIPVRLRQIAGVSVLVGILGLTSILYFTEAKDENSIIYKLKNITNPNEENNIHRVKTWNLTIDLVKDHFVTGVGAGNWKINSRYYFGQTGFTKNQLNWLRPHNDYLWVISEKGIFGILVLLGVFVWTLMMCTSIIRNSKNRNDFYLALFMIFGLIAYMVVALFTFPLERMNHQVYLALIIASVTAVYQRSWHGKNIKLNLTIPVIVAIAILGYGVIYATSVITMETKVKKARNYHRTKQWDKLLDISQTIPSTFKTLDAEAMPIAWYSGLAYSKLENVEKANEAYQKAFEAHPTHVQVINNLGRTYFQLQEYQKAKDVFLVALQVLPDYYQALVNISSTYMQLDEWEKADYYFKKIDRKKGNENLTKMKNAIRRELEDQKRKSNN